MLLSREKGLYVAIYIYIYIYIFIYIYILSNTCGVTASQRQTLKRWFKMVLKSFLNFQKFQNFEK